MSSGIKRALGPARTNLTKKMGEKPELLNEFNNADERTMHVQTLKNYRLGLTNTVARFQKLHNDLIQREPSDDEEAAANGQTIEFDANILAEFDDIVNE